MSYSFDDLRQPQLIYELKDAHNTILHIVPPIKELVDKMRANLSRVLEILNGEDDAAIRQEIYTLAVHVMNCNLDNVHIADGRDLALTYGMSVLDLCDFFIKYAEFINSIENEKN
ncbi:MAG: hypothetical protein ACI4II_05375 [Acutalibacteraceae bacterium]